MHQGTCETPPELPDDEQWATFAVAKPDEDISDDPAPKER